MRTLRASRWMRSLAGASIRGLLWLIGLTFASAALAACSATPAQTHYRATLTVTVIEPEPIRIHRVEREGEYDYDNEPED